MVLGVYLLYGVSVSIGLSIVDISDTCLWRWSQVIGAVVIRGIDRISIDILRKHQLYRFLGDRADLPTSSYLQNPLWWTGWRSTYDRSGQARYELVVES